MELNQGQRGYLLELLSYEYVIPEDYYPCLTQALQRYATTSYTEEEIDFLLKTPQSLAASLMLNTTNSLPSFARHYALWLSCLEHSIYEDNNLVETILINPDPSSKARLLQVINHGDHYQFMPAPEMIYTNNPRPQNAPTAPNSSERRIKPTPLISVWDNNTAESLMNDFLNFANESEIFTQNSELFSSPQNYLNQMEYNLKRSLTKQLTWRELRSRSLLFPQIHSTYVFTDREQGLIMPSNIQFINYLNARPIKGPRQINVIRPVPTFTSPNHLFYKLKANLQNHRQLKGPNLSGFPFITNNQPHLMSKKNPKKSHPAMPKGPQPQGHHSLLSNATPPSQQQRPKPQPKQPSTGPKHQPTTHDPSPYPNHLSFKPVK